MNHEENIKNNILVLDETGKIKSRERIDLEYKETFNLGSSSKYAKTMASFANNIGGYIIFGVKDRPRQIVGVNSAFFEFKQEKLTGILNSFFCT
jgi:predicted HTH transcriptional regulator